MSYSIISSIIGVDSEELKLINSINNSRIQLPKILIDISDFLRDGILAYNKIGDANIAALARFLKRYYDTSLGYYITISKELDKLISSAKTEIYYINALDGERVATTGEVKDGALGLFGKYMYVIGIEKYRLLNLLAWTFTGRLSYYKESGHTYTYNNNILEDNIYTLVSKASKELLKLLDWCGNALEFNNDIEACKKASKQKQYRYPEFAADEVKSELNIRQIIYYLRENLPNKSDNKLFKDAWHLILKKEKTPKYNYTPLDMSKLREAYAELKNYQMGVSETESKSSVNIKLQSDCEKIMQAVKDGKLEKNHFAVKIVNTLHRFGYKRASDGQYAVLNDALAKIREYDEAQEKAANAENNIEEEAKYSSIDTSLMDITDALGKGLLS